MIERVVWFLAGASVGGLLWTALAMAAHRDHPPVEDNVKIVRMLDITVNGLKDRNTTNRRQQFICEPAK